MAVYIGLLFIFIIFILQSNIHKEQKRVLGVILTILMILISGFRYDVGMDYPIYEDMYNKIINGQSVRGEWGFVAICKLCISIGGNAQLMFFIFAIATILLFYKSYRLFSPNVIMSLTIFLCLGQLYLNTFNIVRQSLAIAIFAYSIKYIVNKNPFKYFIAIFIASLFHTTALILAPLYFVLRVKWSKLIKVVFLAVLASSSGIIINIIQNSPYEVYLRFERYTHSASIINILYLGLGLLIILYESKLMATYKDRNVFINLNLICTGLFILYFIFSGTPLVMVVTRMNYYFLGVYAIIFARVICDLKIRTNKVLAESLLYIVLFALYIRNTVFVGGGDNIIPYNINLELF